MRRVVTTRDPGENSTTVTQRGDTTSTVKVTGGGSTTLSVVDDRTDAQKASDEKKDKFQSDATVAGARARYAIKQATAVPKG